MIDKLDYPALRVAIEQCGVHPALGSTGDGWGIEQNPHELATFLAMTSQYNIKTVLEIGTGHRAGLSRFMTEILGWDVTTIDVKMPDTPAPLARQIVAPPRSKWALRTLEGKYDLVIIDGDHAYESAKYDYEHYAPMGHIVMFHDIAGLRDCEGVLLFWDEIKHRDDGALQSYDRHEVIDNSEQRAGIGWIVRANE